MVHRAGFVGRMGPPQGGDSSIVILDLTARSVPSYTTFTRASQATDFNSAGTLTTEGINVPRFDFNPLTLQPRGLLVEGARTNSLLNSVLSGGTSGTVGTTAVAPTGWIFVNTGGTIAYPTTQYGTAGIRTANTNGVDRPAIGQTVNVLANTTYMFTCRVSAIDVGGARLDSIIGVVNTPAGATISYTLNGAPVAGSITTATVGDVLGVQLVVSTTAGTCQCRFGIGTAAGGPFDYTFTMPQFELGPFPSSYIPTTGAAATRADEFANVFDLSTIGFNPLEGTLVAEFESTVPFAAGMPDRCLFTLGTDGTNQARVVLDTTGAIRMASTTASVIDVNVSDGGGVRPPGIYRVAFAYKENDFAICTNGGTVVTDSVCVVPPINQLRIGQNIIGAVPLFDRMRRLNYTPTRLPNAKLQSLTA